MTTKGGGRGGKGAGRGNYGSAEKYHHVYQGNNSRLDEIQAAFLLAKLPHLDRMNSTRRRIASRYINEIVNPKISLPSVLPETEPVWHIFAIRCDERDALKSHLNEHGIDTNCHYPIPVHLQKAYADLGYRNGDFPVAEEISKTELSIPIYYGLSDIQIDYIIDTINHF